MKIPIFKKKKDLLGKKSPKFHWEWGQNRTPPKIPGGFVSGPRFVSGPWFVMRCLVSFLVLQSSRWGGESWLLWLSYCYCVVVGVLCLFGFRFYVPVNRYGHVDSVSSPNHSFFLRKFD